MNIELLQLFKKQGGNMGSLAIYADDLRIENMLLKKRAEKAEAILNKIKEAKKNKAYREKQQTKLF